MHKMHAYFHIGLIGKILLFTYMGCLFYTGTPTLIVKRGKFSFFAWGAYFHSEMLIFTVNLNGHPGARI